MLEFGIAPWYNDFLIMGKGAFQFFEPEKNIMGGKYR